MNGRMEYFREAQGCSLEAAITWRMKNLIRQEAHRRVAIALKAGVLVRPTTCSRCDARDSFVSIPGSLRSNIGTRIEAHHPDYAEPLKVLWLCRLCHRREHGGPRARIRRTGP